MRTRSYNIWIHFKQYEDTEKKLEPQGQGKQSGATGARETIWSYRGKGKNLEPSGHGKQSGAIGARETIWSHRGKGNNLEPQGHRKQSDARVNNMT